MFSIVYVILGLFFLYLSKHKLSIEFGKIIHRFGGTRNSLIIFWSIIFLPGTVIHEMSHFIFAIITGARTGKVEILPSFLEKDWEREEDSGVTLGYVQTQKLNLFQGFLVGIAPFLVGIALLVWISSAIKTSYNTSQIYYLLLQCYLFFTISNSFFPSWTDIKQTVPLIVVVSLFAFLTWLLGFRFITYRNIPVADLFNTISFTLVLSTVTNLIIIGIVYIFGSICAILRRDSKK